MSFAVGKNLGPQLALIPPEKANLRLVRLIRLPVVILVPVVYSIAGPLSAPGNQCSQIYTLLFALSSRGT